MSDVAEAVDRARLLLEQGRIDEAIETLLRAAASHPDDEDLRLEIAHAYVRRGEEHASPGDFAEALKWAPLEQAHLGLAEIDYAAGRFAEARRRFEEVLEADPESPAAREGVAATRLAEGDAAGAEREYRSLAETVRVPACFLGLARALEALHRAGEARDVLDVAAHLFPDDEHVLVAAARTMAPEDRRALLDRAIERNHRSLDAWFEVVRLRCEEKDPEGAVEPLERCLGLDAAETRRRWEAELSDPRSPVFPFADHPLLSGRVM